MPPRRLGNKSVPFSAPPSTFAERLLRWNGLDTAGFGGWEFAPGMKFAERAAWWRAGVRRSSPHEGLDILFFRTADGRRLSLGAGARVPAAYPGEVAAVVDDFLGRSVFLAHDRLDGSGRRLHTAYGHIDPAPGLEPGGVVGDGDAVGAIASPPAGKVSVPPHLHLTLALVRRDIGPAALDWGILGDPARALLLDPLPLLCGTMVSGS